MVGLRRRMSGVVDGHPTWHVQFDTDAEEVLGAFTSAWWQAHVAGRTLMLHGVSLLLDLCVSPHVVKEIVGHSAIDVTMTIYAIPRQRTRGAEAAE
jgi:hypothetical protein